MDSRPLRESPAIRRLWAGSCPSSIGEQMTTFAVTLQVFTLTHHSAAAVGAVGLTAAVPALLFGLFGGALTDTADRRTLVLACSSALAVVSALLAVQAFAGSTRVWPLYALVAAQSLLNTVNIPARRTFMPRLLPADRVPAGAALNLFSGHLSVTLGPALAGVVTAAWGLRTCYLLDVASFAAALYGAGRLPPMPPERGDARPGVRSVVEGMRFLRGERVLAGALLADMSATVLGMPFGILPSINAERFGNSPHTLGLLMAAPAVGGIVGSALSGPAGRVSRHGRAMLVASAVWGAGIAGLGGWGRGSLGRAFRSRPLPDRRVSCRREVLRPVQEVPDRQERLGVPRRVADLGVLEPDQEEQDHEAERHGREQVRPRLGRQVGGAIPRRPAAPLQLVGERGGLRPDGGVLGSAPHGREVGVLTDPPERLGAHRDGDGHGPARRKGPDRVPDDRLDRLAYGTDRVERGDRGDRGLELAHQDVAVGDEPPEGKDVRHLWQRCARGGRMRRHPRDCRSHQVTGSRFRRGRNVPPAERSPLRRCP